MIKKSYILVWFLLVGSVLTSIFTGTFDVLSLVAVSLIAVGLVYALALWAVFRDPQGMHMK
jgi:hypothetical protein